jgi:heptaprenyl diphosphate synthase
VVGQGLLNGTFASYVFLFSMFGSVAATCAMIAAHRIGKRAISLLGISIFGALASNAVQILLSIQFIFGANALIIAPVFLGFGTASGVAMGIFALVFVRRSKWYRNIHEKFSSRSL